MERMVFANASITGVLVCLMTPVTVPTVSAPMILPGWTIQTVRVVFTSTPNVQDRDYVLVMLVKEFYHRRHLFVYCRAPMM